MATPALLCLSALLAVGLAGIPGGFTDVSLNDPDFQSALNFALVLHNQKTNDVYLRQVTEVLRAQSQVVAGIKYVMTVRLARTSCRKNSPSSNCLILSDPSQAQPSQCTFTVWSRPWMNSIQLLEERC